MAVNSYFNVSKEHLTAKTCRVTVKSRHLTFVGASIDSEQIICVLLLFKRYTMNSVAPGKIMAAPAILM